MYDGVHLLNQYLQDSQRLSSSDQQHAAVESVGKNESAWVSDFAQPMLQKRKEVDAGNATVADLQIFYLQKDAAAWVKTSTDSLNEADREIRQTLDERRKIDDNAGKWTIFLALCSTLIAIALGIVIAYRTAYSITHQLSE